ncbi:MAG: hypothetical protein ACJ719_00350 [Nitrososphaeraceae archaeon]
MPRTQISKDNDKGSEGSNVAEGLSESLNFTVEEAQILDTMDKKN